MAAQAPVQNGAPMEKSEMQKDVDHWMGRLNHVAANSSEITQPTGTAPWYTGFFECFNPIDTCLITCCCPCVTFGRTHHRLHKDANLAGYNVVNASCLGWWASSCFGAHCIGTLLQRSDVRNRANPPLSGDFITDFLKSWCCSCCTLIQQEKEAQHLLANESVVNTAPGVKQEQMTYPA